MINLIPPAAKKKVLVEYWVRVISVWLILWAVTLFVSASILLPTYVLISTQVAVHEESAEIASQKVASYENVSVALIGASQQAKMVADEEALPRFSEYLDLVESLQGSDIQITEVSMSRDEQGFTPIMVSGVATDRLALASFKDRLLANAQIAVVDLPISNLARDKNIAFTITITLAKQEQV